jgi:hypothetical protein
LGAAGFDAAGFAGIVVIVCCGVSFEVIASKAMAATPITVK